MEDITDAYYKHAKRVCRGFKIRYLGECHNLDFQNYMLLLVNVFENFRNMSHKIYGLELTHFLSAAALAWQGVFKKTKVKLEILTDIDMLLFAEKGIRGGIFHAIHRNIKANKQIYEKL